MHGGARPGAGRKKGSQTKRTQEIVAAVTSQGLTPLEFLVSVMQNESHELNVRIDAAKAAASYVHPRLAAVEHSGDKENPIHQSTRIEMVLIDAATDADNTSSDSTEARASH